MEIQELIIVVAGEPDGRAEDERPDEVDTNDEQHQTVSERDSDGGTDLQLEYHERNAEDRRLPFFNLKAELFHAVLTQEELKGIEELETPGNTYLAKRQMGFTEGNILEPLCGIPSL